NIELEYRGDNKTKDVSVNDNVISVEYYQQPEGREPFGIYPTVIDDVKVELDLSKIDDWTPEQLQEAGDLKAAAENVDKDALTPSELKTRYELLVKLEDVPATPQEVKYDDGMQKVGGSALEDLFPIDTVTKSPLSYVSSHDATVKPEDDAAAKPGGEY
ncbi:MAG: hypothetical protein ACR2P1_15925, partial [Pseudomonadales bacterium]